MAVLSALRPWQIATLIIILLVTVGATYFVYSRITSEETVELEENQQLIPVQRGDLINEISISGSVNFPERENMTFGSDGVVSDVLISEGERVLAGDVVAVLDAESVASLQRAVVEARAELRDANEELSELLNPSELSLAESQQRVADAEDTLAAAMESLDSIVRPSSLEIADMEAAIATAAKSLRDAEDALADELEPVSDLALAQAHSRVVDAEIALADVEAGATELEIAEAVAAVADADLALQAAVEALTEYRAGATVEDMVDARKAVQSAQTALSNSLAKLAVSEREWDVRVQDSQDELDAAATIYAEIFEKWLGIKPSTSGFDPNYELALQVLGADLETVFAQSNRYTDLAYDAVGSPSDDPATAWNEAHVYAWLNFAIAKLTATCDPGDIPVFGICIEEEFRLTGDAYQAAIDQKADTAAAASDALAAAETAVDAAETAMKAATETLGDLQEPPDPLVLARLMTDVDVAAARVNDLELELADLRQPSDLLEISSQQRELALAKATLADARQQLEDLIAGPESTMIEYLQQQMDLASANLEDLRGQQAELLSGERHPDHAKAFHEVVVARLMLKERQEELDDLMNGPDPIDEELLTARVGAAQTLVEQSEQRLADASLTAPWDGFVSRIDVDGGQEVMATDVVVALVDTSIVEVDGSVDEIDVLNVEIGAAAEVTMDALPGRTLTGSVSFVGAEANSDQGVVSYPVRVRFDLPPDLKAPAGLSAVASITINEEIGVLLAPINSIRGSFTQPTVNVMVDGQIVERPVTLGSSDEFWTVVTSGLAEGDTVVGSTVASGDRPNVTFGPGGGRGPRR